jgi:uncharacterized protein YndB with AHSA1/START domain
MPSPNHRPIALLALASLAACGPSVAELDRLAAAGAVQPDAAVASHREIEVAAPPALVWEVLADAAGWPRWHPPIQRVEAAGPLEAGAAFAWSNRGTGIRSRVALSRAPEVLAWTGTASVAKAVHVWRLVPGVGGGTRVSVDETMDGPLFGWLYPKAKLDADVEGWLADLRAEAERRGGR